MVSRIASPLGAGLLEGARRLGRFLYLFVLPALLLAAWEILSRRGVINPSILPAPSTIWATALDLTRSGELPTHIRVSLARVAWGFSIGGSLGIAAGILIGLSPKVDRATFVLTGVLRPIPIIAWVPVLILWVGIDEASKITVIAIGSFWPVLINTVHGIRSTDRKYLEVARILGKGRWRTLVQVVLPSALPSIFAGVRIGIGIAWMSVIGAELIAAASGVGYLIMYARELSQPDVMLVGVLSIGLVGIAIELLLRSLERRFLRWNVNHRKPEAP